MLDIDKWNNAIQVIAGFGMLVGGLIAGFFGSRLGVRKPEDDRAQDREDERKRVELQAQVNEDRIRRDFELAVGAARKSFYDEMRRIEGGYQRECGEIENRLRKVENEHAAALVEIDALKGDRRRPRN